jgi:hypothetical protein
MKYHTLPGNISLPHCRKEDLHISLAAELPKMRGLERCRGSLIPEQMEDKWFIYYMENWLTSICTLTGIYLFTSVFVVGMVFINC